MFRLAAFLVTLLACPLAAQAQSFWTVFTELPGDVARLAQPANLVTLGAAGGGALAVKPKDPEIVDSLRSDSGFWDAGDLTGQGAMHAAAGLTLFAGGHLAHSREAAQLGIDLLRGQIVSGAITDSLKGVVTRERPGGGSHSFPSGHSSSAFATAAVLQGHYGWRAGIPAYAVAAYVGGSRLATSRHYLSDVLFGAGIGLASGHAVVLGHKSSPAGVTISPTVRHGGPYLQVTIVPGR